MEVFFIEIFSTCTLLYSLWKEILSQCPKLNNARERLHFWRSSAGPHNVPNGSITPKKIFHSGWHFSLLTILKPVEKNIHACYIKAAQQKGNIATSKRFLPAKGNIGSIEGGKKQRANERKNELCIEQIGIVIKSN